MPPNALNNAAILVLSSSRRCWAGLGGRCSQSYKPDFDTPNQAHIWAIVGASATAVALVSARSAAMNAYFSLTAAPSRSTQPLFLKRRFPSPVHDCGVRAHATAPVPITPKAAHHRHALSGIFEPRCPRWCHSTCVPERPRRSIVGLLRPAGPPLHETQGNTFDTFWPQ